MEQKMRRAVFGIVAFLLILTSFFLFRLFSISVAAVVEFPFTALGFFLTTTVASDIFLGLAAVGTLFLKFLSPMLMIVIGFAVLTLYGMLYGEDKRLGVASIGAASLVGFFILGIGIPSLLFFAALLISGLLVTGLGETFYAELKKWKEYRTGTHCIGRLFLLINLSITAGIFFAIILNLNYYEGIYSEHMASTLYQLIPQAIPQAVDEMPIDAADIVRPMITDIMQTKQVKMMIYLVLLSTPLIVLGLIEFLKSVLFCPVAGIITSFARFRKE